MKRVSYSFFGNRLWQSSLKFAASLRYWTRRVSLFWLVAVLTFCGVEDIRWKNFTRATVRHLSAWLISVHSRLHLLALRNIIKSHFQRDPCWVIFSWWITYPFLRCSVAQWPKSMSLQSPHMRITISVPCVSNPITAKPAAISYQLFQFQVSTIYYFNLFWNLAYSPSCLFHTNWYGRPGSKVAIYVMALPVNSESKISRTYLYLLLFNHLLLLLFPTFCSTSFDFTCDQTNLHIESCIYHEL